MKITIIYNDIGGEKLPVLSDDPKFLESWVKISVAFSPVMKLARNWAGVLDGAGIHTAKEFANLYHHGNTQGGAGCSDKIKEFLPLIDEVRRDKIAGAFIYSAVCLYLECGKDFDFANYIYHAITTREGDAVEISTEHAKAWQSVQKIQADMWDVVDSISNKLSDIVRGVCDDDLDGYLKTIRPPVEDPDETQPQEDGQKPVNIPGITPPTQAEKKTRGRKKAEGTPAQGVAPKAKAQGVEIVEAEEITLNNAVSYDFYKMLDEMKATEDTKKIAEYVALSFGNKLREFAEANPAYNTETKEFAIKSKLLAGEGLEIPKEYFAPIPLTPDQMAKDFFPNDYKKAGKAKTARRALEAFAPLQKAFISIPVHDEATGENKIFDVQLFTFAYLFKEGTPDDVRQRVRENTADADALDAIEKIFVSPSIMMIANQFSRVANVETWRRCRLYEKSEAVNIIARRLALFNSHKIGLDNVIAPDEMPDRWKLKPQERTKGILKACEHVKEMNGKEYGYSETGETRNFVRLDVPKFNKPKEDGQKTKAKADAPARATTRRATKRSNRGRPRKTT